MGTKERLEITKELLSQAFLKATEQSLAQGLQFKYKSYGVVLEGDQKGWVIDIIVKEAGYGERTIQQLKFLHPNNIDNKNMELNALLELLGSIVQGAITTWYEVAKMLASDIQLQKTVIDGAKEDNIASF
jgi:hypothetical protein